ncbi:glycine betaine/proline transport system substrate-binding protein [Streptomyces zhaozhouensis]|uniref:Glycine betaine/proline transport system substrate-binding protein n=1 Tax=Streptomyces zhaozhouensis TaxID=1300267 RepID=A0A286DXS6_9ACTN|nr:glycine betaine ABC transporter substrate-binding protein [Streptomyces zhaozhouensis]SOD63430.1 glycine betaine/proline transport system substrate-binding protein [Streptomyces zhaozhouensis]
MRTPTPRLRQLSAVAVAAGLGLSLAACGGSDDDESNGGGDGKSITLGYIPSWTDGLSTAYLLENLLEEAGYTVEHEEISEAGVLYTALSEGDVDMFPSAWPEVTHASYMEQYGDRIEDIGAYYDNAVLTFAVPEYSEITSIDQLPDHVDELGGQIVGIEPGAGLTEVTQNEVIPTYGLDEAGYSLSTSSTSTMLTELGNAIDQEEEIVVTLWRPFWANAEYPVRDLEDPEGALGEPEALHFLGKEGFADEFPEVAEWIEGIKLSDEEYGSLEDLVVNEHADDPAAGVEAWLEDNADVVGAPPAAS